LDVPVDEIGVEALLSELSWLGIALSINQVFSLHRPIAESHVLPTPPEVLEDSISSLVHQSKPSLLIKLSSKELNFGTNFLSFFTGHFNFNAWSKEVHLSRNLIMIFQQKVLHL